MERFINISNSLQVIVSEFNGTLMLELRGGFKPQRLSVGKINFVLAHATKLHNLVKDAKEGHYTLDKDSSVILSKFQGVMMFELRGPFKPARISENKLNAILAHQKELRQIIADNTTETLVKEETNKAKKALQQNSATMPSDKKSPVDVSAMETRFDEILTGYAQGTLTDFASWMSANYDVTTEQARQWIDDKEYQNEFIAYLESCKVVARPQKRVATPTVSERPAKRESSAAIQRFEKETGQKFETTKEQTKKGRGIPVSFSVMTNIGKTNITRAASGIDAIRLLKGKTLIHPQTKETRLIDDRGENNSHWYATNVRDGFIFNVKRLDA